MKKKWLIRVLLAITIALVMVLGVSLVAWAIPDTVTDFNGMVTDTSVYLSWTPAPAPSSNSTVITYSTISYPAWGAGLPVYSGTGYYYNKTGLTPGATYYFSAWGYDGANHSETAATLAVTTLPTTSANITIPINRPSLPLEALQQPSIGGWNIHPLDYIIDYFTDNTSSHGGLGMPTNNFVLFLASMIITALGLFTYIKWRNFFSSFAIVFILSFLAVGMHIMQGYVIGIEIIIGAGYWAVEHNFQ